MAGRSEGVALAPEDLVFTDDQTKLLNIIHGVNSTLRYIAKEGARYRRYVHPAVAAQDQTLFDESMQRFEVLTGISREEKERTLEAYVERERLYREKTAPGRILAVHGRSAAYMEAHARYSSLRQDEEAKIIKAVLLPASLVQTRS